MKKRLLAILMICCMVLPLAGTMDIISVNADEVEAEVVIYHTNDTHGYLSGDGESVIGIDTVAGLKESTPNSILVDAGDATQGLPLASLTKGADVMELMNLAGYDLMTAGNHEFDFGTEQFLSNVKLAEFPVLAANIYRDGKPLLDGEQKDNNGCHTIMECNGKKIGFFGLTTVQTATATNPTGIQDLEFKDEIETAKKEIKELEAENVDAIIAVCHLGDGDAPCTSEDLAGSLTGEYQDKLDVIIDGHSHTVENEEVNGILIAQTGSGMSNLGKLTLEFDKDDNVTAVENLLTPSDLANVTPKKEVTEKLNEIEAEQGALLEEKVGSTETTLWAGWIGDIAMTRMVETNFGDFTADAFVDAGKTFIESTDKQEKDLPIIAVENGGGIREAVANGTIVQGDLISAFPFSNTLYMKKITPKVLYEMMEVSGSSLAGQDKETGRLLQEESPGGFLQIAGFNVVYDPDASKGNRVTSITLDGQTNPLDKNDDHTQIMLVSNNFIMDGGNDYTMLADIPKYGEAGGELETISAYLEKCLQNDTLKDYAGTQGRIQMRSEGYEPKPYTASIQIIDESGNPVIEKDLSYRVDGGKRQNGTTDKDGFLKITLSDGAHGVRLADTQQEIYVDNYTGIGLIEDNLRSYPVLTFFADGSCDPVSDPQQDQNGAENDVQETVQKTEKEDTSKSPETGDDFTELYIIMAVCALGTAVAVKKKDKKIK